MDEILEVMVISDAGNKGSNCMIYNLKDGSAVSNFKEGNSVPKGLSFIADDYLLSALSEKPALKVWTLTKSNSENNVMICPGFVSCLAVTHCGGYCAAGIQGIIYLWDVCSGTLLCKLQDHSGQVSCLRFTSDGSFLISGGNDARVHVYMLSVLVDTADPHDNRKLKPHFVWLDHSGGITDICVGKLGCYARVATVSRDMTCKIYELESGNLITTICTDFEITAVTMDNAEYFLLLGSSEGKIYKINLFSVRDGEVLHTSSESSPAFVGHKGEITCLSLSTMDTYLLSGSEDSMCRLWDMNNFSCIRKMPCTGAVTNAFIALVPPGLKVNRNYIPQLPMSLFNRNTDNPSCVPQKISDTNLSLSHIETPDQYFEASMLEVAAANSIHQPKSKVSVQELETINQQLYAYALCDLVSRRAAERDETE